MTEFIEREDALDRIDGIWDCADMVFEPEDHCCSADDCAHCKWRETKNAIRKIIANIHAADVRPVVRGRWIDLDECSNEGVYCSNCQKKVYKFSYSNTMKRKSNYCPNCGAKMDKED